MNALSSEDFLLGKLFYEMRGITPSRHTSTGYTFPMIAWSSGVFLAGLILQLNSLYGFIKEMQEEYVS